MIKIAITDDHPLLLEGLKNILSKSELLEVVGCFPDADTMHTALTKISVDVLLLDINLPDANSIELIGSLRIKYPKMHIIIISVHNEYAVINSVIQEGAHGYIQKNASVEEIINGIEQILKGNKFLCSQTKIIVDKKTKDELKIVPKLTRREKEVLSEAASGLTTSQIGEKLFISPHTVESHRKNLIEKFGAKNLNSVIKLAIEYGLIRQ
ncbi:DNA-binding response regulator [Sphingobacterium faecium NBRC 15299]|uniref:response regulator transcription factor n=1 Tax=Sphingobacterium faecium TaxID=34087 RepID=UPI000D3D4090|nr:response regulator transcription factor [Sphingobacterium faecium]PTX09772.1 LuxR family two component transcriptional regulator [Sphingobacterium faecium]GEM63617.1 DNA-binding response regulator [Sphingobacterium faecium NBRC 15299]